MQDITPGVRVTGGQFRHTAICSARAARAPFPDTAHSRSRRHHASSSGGGVHLQHPAAPAPDRDPLPGGDIPSARTGSGIGKGPGGRPLQVKLERLVASLARLEARVDQLQQQLDPAPGFVDQEKDRVINYEDDPAAWAEEQARLLRDRGNRGNSKDADEGPHPCRACPPRCGARHRPARSSRTGPTAAPDGHSSHKADPGSPRSAGKLTAISTMRAALSTRPTPVPAPSPPLPEPSAKPEQATRSIKAKHERYRRAHDLLVERYPAIFAAARPLAIGVDKQLRDAFSEEELPTADLKAFLRTWVNRKPYRAALARGDRRVNLDGSDAGPAFGDIEAVAAPICRAAASRRSPKAAIVDLGATCRRCAPRISAPSSTCYTTASMQ